MAQDTVNSVFIIDDDLIERLMRGDAPASSKNPKREVPSNSLADAVVLAQNGLPGDAIRELEKAIAADGESVDLYNALGHLQFEKQLWSAAEQSYTKAAKLDSYSVPAQYNRALCLERQGKLEQALEAFATVVALDGKRWQAHLGRGMCLLKLQRSEDSLEWFDAALKLTVGQNQDRILGGKAVALHQTGKLDEALDAYTKLLLTSPESPELLANLTLLCVARKEPAKIAEYAQRLLKVDPQSQQGLTALAEAALLSGDFEAAAQQCSGLVKAAPEHYPAWFNLGLSLQKTGRLEEAANAYREAIRIRPDSPEANANLGAIEQERGDLVAARASYSRALNASPGLAGPLWNLALEAEKAGDAAEAERHYANLVAANPAWGNAAFRLGYLQLQRGDYVAAVDSFEACLKYRNDWPEALVNLGIASWKFGDYETASRVLRRVLSIVPESAPEGIHAPSAASKEAALALTAMAIEQNDAQHARESHAQFVALGGELPELAFNVGLVLQTSGDHAGAAECYRNALDGLPECTGALLNLGHALSSLGREQEARSVWAKAVTLNPELASAYFEP